MDGSSRIEGGRNELSRVEQTFGGTFRFFRSLREGILCPRFVALSIVVLTVPNQFMDELIDRCDRIGWLGHIDVVDMPI